MYQGFVCRRADYRRSTGVLPDATIVEIYIPDFNALAFKALPVENRFLAPDARVNELVGLTNPPTELQSSGTLTFFEEPEAEGDGPYRLDIEGLHVTAVEKSDGANADGFVTLTLTDDRAFWDRGFMDRWEYRVTNDAGKQIKNSFFDTVETLQDLSKLIMARFPFEPDVTRIPLDWETEKFSQFIGSPFERPKKALSRFLKLYPARVVLHHDRTVGFYQEGEGRVGFTENGSVGSGLTDSEGGNQFPLPRKLLQDLGGQGHVDGIQFNNRPDQILVVGGPRYVTTDVVMEPVVMVRGRPFPIWHGLALIDDFSKPEGSFSKTDIEKLFVSATDKDQARSSMMLQAELIAHRLDRKTIEHWGRVASRRVLKPTSKRDGFSPVYKAIDQDAFRLFRIKGADDALNHLLPIHNQAETIEGKRVPPAAYSMTFKKRSGMVRIMDAAWGGPPGNLVSRSAATVGETVIGTVDPRQVKLAQDDQLAGAEATLANARTLIEKLSQLSEPLFFSSVAKLDNHIKRVEEFSTAFTTNANYHKSVYQNARNYLFGDKEDIDQFLEEASFGLGSSESEGEVGVFSPGGTVESVNAGQMEGKFVKVQTVDEAYLEDLREGRWQATKGELDGTAGAGAWRQAANQLFGGFTTSQETDIAKRVASIYAATFQLRKLLLTEKGRPKPNVTASPLGAPLVQKVEIIDGNEEDPPSNVISKSRASREEWTIIQAAIQDGVSQLKYLYLAEAIGAEELTKNSRDARLPQNLQRRGDPVATYTEALKARNEILNFKGLNKKLVEQLDVIGKALIARNFEPANEVLKAADLAEEIILAHSKYLLDQKFAPLPVAIYYTNEPIAENRAFKIVDKKLGLIRFNQPQGHLNQENVPVLDGLKLVPRPVVLRYGRAHKFNDDFAEAEVIDAESDLKVEWDDAARAAGEQVLGGLQIEAYHRFFKIKNKSTVETAQGTDETLTANDSIAAIRINNGQFILEAITEAREVGLALLGSSGQTKVVYDQTLVELAPRIGVDNRGELNSRAYALARNAVRKMPEFKVNQRLLYSRPFRVNCNGVVSGVSISSRQELRGCQTQLFLGSDTAVFADENKSRQRAQDPDLQEPGARRLPRINVSE